MRIKDCELIKLLELQELSKHHRVLYEGLLSLTSVTNNFAPLISAIKDAPQPKLVPTCMPHSDHAACCLLHIA